MENYYAKHHLKIMAQSIIEMKKALGQFEQSIFVLLGCYETEEALGVNNTDCQSPASTSQFNQGNGSQEIVSQPLSTEKSVEEIIQEVKEMIIELKIKGSIREHRNGLLKFHNTVFGSIYGRTKEEIEKQLLEKIKEQSTSKNQKAKKKDAILLSEFYKESYLPYKKKTLTENSIEGIEVWFRFLMNSKMDKPLNRYTAAEIEKFLYSIPLTRKRQMVRGVINNILNYAKRLGIIKTNPCDNVDIMKHEKENGRALSFKDQADFFNNINSPDCKASEMERLYLTFVYLTGMRRQEALDITTTDIDWDNNVLHVPGTKTEGSDRSIPLFPLVRRLLEKITPQKDGRYFKIVPNAASACIKKITADYHLHELRHTFGTIAICVQKLDPKTVSLWMGHSTVAMTLSTYTHPEQLDKALFYNGSIAEEQKLVLLREQYQGILQQISDFLG